MPRTLMTIVVSALALAILSCGGPSGGYGSDPAPAPPPATGDAAYDKVAPIIAADCGPCHGVKPGIPVFSSAAAFKASNAKAELSAGAMPPAPRTISASDKAALLAYLGG